MVEKIDKEKLLNILDMLIIAVQSNLCDKNTAFEQLMKIRVPQIHEEIINEFSKIKD